MAQQHFVSLQGDNPAWPFNKVVKLLTDLGETIDRHEPLDGDVQAIKTWCPGPSHAPKSEGGGTAANITFPSIPQTCSSLWVLAVARSDIAAAFTNVRLQLNSDTAANYDGQELFGNAATAAAAQYIATTAMDIGQIAANTATAGASGQLDIMIDWYANTTFWKQVASNHVMSTGTGSGTLYAKQWSGRWRNIAAITSITILPQAGNFVTGSSFALYGIP